MGWASASRIFDTTTHALIRSGATDKVLGDTCYALAKELTDGDWDTVDESIGEFRAHPTVVSALRRADSWHDVDDKGTAVMDYDERANEWVLTVGGTESGRRLGTAEGHDELVRAGFVGGNDTLDRREQMARSLINPGAEESDS